MTVNPESQGLYDRQFEHDACGIGAVVDISGRPDHAILEHGREVLKNLRHRGAAGADNVTGDGAGILLQIPHELLVTECQKSGTYCRGPDATASAWCSPARTPWSEPGGTGSWRRRSTTTVCK